MISKQIKTRNDIEKWICIKYPKFDRKKFMVMKQGARYVMIIIGRDGNLHKENFLPGNKHLFDRFPELTEDQLRMYTEKIAIKHDLL